MKPVEQPHRRLSELVRGLFYPVVPILGVACVWAYAYAGSLESKLERDLGPRDDDTYVSRLISKRLAEDRENHPVAGLHVTYSDDDGN